jgi:hypothetical protein
LAVLFLLQRAKRADPHPLQEGDAEAKYWLDVQAYEVTEAYAYGMSPADRRTVRSIIFQHFEYIVSEWTKFQELKND